ncbi:DUF1289 domain-containing protein [Motilimonas eburnea]|uniref:DUF1289 domain-containing protein n=1 Tax=Motilimonas eburnea TaxID=1737488 RepID=UPI001E4C154D|nr:DUF1289 domain-containing protein [Motilimonas eburnea]MCE2573572.1 DUF1289 domain-containing protein [Motilimonas eburnea]
MTHLDVPSPCVRNCCLDEQDICMGCHRSLDEIIAWHDSSYAQKQAIITQAKQRASKVRQVDMKLKPPFTG